MFRVHVRTPPVTDEAGLPHAGGVLQIGDARLPFLVDLTYWCIADYERQWRAALRRLVYEAPYSALVTAYRGPGEAPHTLWALWRDEDHVYVR